MLRSAQWTVLEVHPEGTHAVERAQRADHRREEPLEAPEVVGRRGSGAVLQLGQQPRERRGDVAGAGRERVRHPLTPVVLEHCAQRVGHRHQGHLAGEVQAAADGDEDVRRGHGSVDEGRLADACLARDQQQPGARRQVVSYDPQLGDATRDPDRAMLVPGPLDGVEAASHSSRVRGTSPPIASTNSSTVPQLGSTADDSAFETVVWETPVCSASRRRLGQPARWCRSWSASTSSRCEPGGTSGRGSAPIPQGSPIRCGTSTWSRPLPSALSAFVNPCQPLWRRSHRGGTAGPSGPAPRRDTP